MSEFLFEDPVTLGVTGMAFTLVAAITWIKGGYSAALYSALAFFLLTIVLLILNLQVTTHREEVQDVISQVAAAVKRNDLEGVLKYVHASRSAALNRAKAELPNYHFSEARITGIKQIEINSETNPPSAIAEFNVAVDVTAHNQPFTGIRRFVRCYFLRTGDKWLVSDYEHFEPTYGFKEPSVP